jgi:hypothetical protein
LVDNGSRRVDRRQRGLAVVDDDREESKVEEDGDMDESSVLLTEEDKAEGKRSISARFNFIVSKELLLAKVVSWDDSSCP